ncbi:MAG: hypothetical protein WAM62_13585 [Pseudolabrys sp.]
MIARMMLSAACTVALLAVSASAQEKPVRVRGTIEAVDGPMLSIKSRDGDMLKVKMADGIKVTAMVKAELSDIKPGSFVGSTAMPQPDGSWKAVEVHIFPEAMRGTGIGDRPFDYRPKSTMTNGTVVGGSAAGATVDKSDNKSIVLNFKDGEKKIDVVPETVIYTYAPGNKDELKSGAVVFITAAMRQADGSLTADRINVARGVAPPM